MENHFCTCPAVKCRKHPSNHTEGCDPCVKSNLEQLEMPTCFFLAVHNDPKAVTDYSFAGFVEYFQRHRDEYLEKRKKPEA